MAWSNTPFSEVHAVASLLADQLREYNDRENDALIARVHGLAKSAQVASALKAETRDHAALEADAAAARAAVLGNING